MINPPLASRIVGLRKKRRGSIKTQSLESSPRRGINLTWQRCRGTLLLLGTLRKPCAPVWVPALLQDACFKWQQDEFPEKLVAAAGCVDAFKQPPVDRVWLVLWSGDTVNFTLIVLLPHGGTWIEAPRVS